MKKNYLLQLLFCCALLITANQVAAQPLPCPPASGGVIAASATRLIVCDGGCDTLFVSGIVNNLPTTDSYRVDSFTYNPYSYISGTNYPLAIDDQYGAIEHLTFPFCFYGTKYYSCVIGSNGELSFDTTLANTYCSWPCVAAVPSTNASQTSGTLNCIMCPYQDIDMVYGGAINYYVSGTSPCRVFVVNWDTAAFFSCGWTIYTTQQIVLHESTYQIDINIKHKDDCSGWNSGWSILGVQNATGTKACTAPGKNATVWSGSNLSYSFLPAGTANNSTTIKWYDSATNALLATTDTVIVCPTTTTTYKVVVVEHTACDSFVYQNFMTVAVGGNINISSTEKQDPSTCGKCDGKIVLHGLVPNQVDTVFYTRNGSATPTKLVMMSQADSSITLDTLCAGIYTNVFAKRGVCSSNVVGPIVLNNPPLTPSFQFSLAYACPADTLHLTNLSSAPGATVINYTWKFGDGSTDTTANPVHVYTTQGNYNVVLEMTNTYCVDSMTLNVNTLHPLHASFSNPDTICRDQPVTFTNTSITSQPTGIAPTFSWDFGNGGVSSDYSPTFTYNHNDSGIHIITLVATDFVPCIDVTSRMIDILWKPYHHDYNVTYCSDGVLPIGITLDDVSYKWTTGDSVCCIIPPATGMYVQTTTNRCGTTYQNIGVRIDSCVKCLFVPSAFTPNGDNHDDLLHVRAICPIRQFSMKIYNRFGVVVYSSNSINQGWDGFYNSTPLDIGTYMYTIEYMPDLPEARSYFLKGDITLIR